jgi:hypothetical protein
MLHRNSQSLLRHYCIAFESSLPHHCIIICIAFALLRPHHRFTIASPSPHHRLTIASPSLHHRLAIASPFPNNNLTFSPSMTTHDKKAERRANRGAIGALQRPQRCDEGGHIPGQERLLSQTIIDCRSSLVFSKPPPRHK